MNVVSVPPFVFIVLRGTTFICTLTRFTFYRQEARKGKKYNFYCVVKISVCVTGPHDSKGLSTFLCFRRVSEGHFIAGFHMTSLNFKLQNY